MSVLIKGMEMPESCDKCELMTANYGCAFIGAVGGESYRKRAWDCPLIEVGRINDKITLKDAIETHAWTMLYAAEPTRPVDVTMSYADLWAIFKWIKESVPESEDE